MRREKGERERAGGICGAIDARGLICQSELLCRARARALFFESREIWQGAFRNQSRTLVWRVQTRWAANVVGWFEEVLRNMGGSYHVHVYLVYLHI